MPEPASRLLEELRPGAFAIAYRMLGTVSEAEDAVQEALLRLHSVLRGGERISSPRAYVSTVVTRLCIDELRSARARRESYVGDWLPEPVVTDPSADPADHAEMADSLSLAFLTLLESLSPEQRAAFLLREVFDYPYDEVARIVGKSPQATRQLVARARKHTRERSPRFEASRERSEELARRFIAALEAGEINSLEEVLAEDVVLYGDGGGKVPAITRPVLGREHVARTLLAWMRSAERFGGFQARWARVNGQPGALALDPRQRVVGVVALDIAEGGIHTVRSLINPEKLQHLGPTANLGDLLRGEDD